jgi:hypothetical protein
MVVVNAHHHHFSTSVGMDRAETIMRRSTRTFLHFGGEKELLASSIIVQEHNFTFLNYTS